MRSVYLAGPITGLTYERAHAWREDATEMLTPEFEVVDPMRGYAPTPANEYDHLADDFDGGGRVAVQRCLKDVRNCDVVLVNFPIGRPPSVGTLCELGYAAACKDLGDGTGITRWPLIVAFGGGQDHVFLRELTDKHFTYLGDACNWLAEVVA